MDETMLLLTGLLGTVFVIVLFGAALGGAWLIGRNQSRRGVDGERSPRLSGAEDLASVARAVEALTLEVERVAEAQRYTARVLTELRALERGADGPTLPRSAGRVNTPH